MVTGCTHASHCATEPIYPTVTDNYAQNLMPTITLQKIPWVNLKFPEFSLSLPELKNSLSFLGFPELHKHRSSVNFRGHVIFVYKYVRKINKMPEF